jgi:hypothetical protein
MIICQRVGTGNVPPLRLLVGRNEEAQSLSSVLRVLSYPKGHHRNQGRVQVFALARKICS